MNVYTNSFIMSVHYLYIANRHAIAGLDAKELKLLCRSTGLPFKACFEAEAAERVES